MSSFFGSSHSSHLLAGRITGMRSWIGCIVSFADVVMIVDE